ncbi:glycosyltransferase family 39 protein [Actinoplanes sp. NBC_00393]|uniref:glycosyltransferase family 39 protein n=1 Tax=Actinoplanes sp. NBC_00393 TaxID=2975953 RepID=UPI002E1D9DCE
MLAQSAHDDSPSRPLSGPRRSSPRRAATVFWIWAPSLVPAALTAAVGLLGLAGPALGPDETLRLTLSVPDPAAIVESARLADAVNAPYHLFLHYWTGLFGDAASTVRLPSLVAMVLGVGFAGELGRRILSPGAGLYGGLLLVALVPVSRYAQEAGPYALAFLFATAATLVLYRTLDRPRWWRWTGYGLLVIGTGLAQVTALLMLAGHAYIVVSRWRLSRQSALFWWFPVTVLSLVPPAPLISLGLRQHAALLAFRPQARWEMAWSAPEALAGAAGLVVAGLALAARWPDRALIRELAVLAAVPPLVLLAGSFLTGPLWAPQHVLFVLPPIALCAAVALRGLRLRAVLVLALVVLLAVPQHRAVRAPSGHQPLALAERHHQDRLGATAGPVAQLDAAAQLTGGERPDDLQT